MSTATPPAIPVEAETPRPGPDTTEPVPPDRALKAAKPPVGSGLSPLFGQLAAIGLIALGVVGVQETVHRLGLATTSWTSWVLTQVDDRRASFALLVLCVLLSVAGLALLVVVFRPRPRRALTLTATTGVYLRTGDLARLARSAVDGAEAVTDVSAAATRSRLTMTVSTVAPAADNHHLQSEVERRLQPLFDALDSAPRLVVTIDNQELT